MVRNFRRLQETAQNMRKLINPNGYNLEELEEFVLGSAMLIGMIPRYNFND